MADVLLDALLCLSALIPTRIGKEGLILQGVVEPLGVLLGRQSCYEKRERVRGNISLHREPLR